MLGYGKRIQMRSPKNESNENMDALRRFDAECSKLLKPLEDHLKVFNIFDVLGCTYTEIRHSNVLAWLLDPNENHGLSDAFLRNWLAEVFSSSDKNESACLNSSEIIAAKFQKVEVLREWEHVDILIQIRLAGGLNWVVCIENKVRAQQRDQQLSDYKQVVSRHHSPSDKYGFIFLRKSEEEPDDDAFVVANYLQVAKILDECCKMNIPAGPRQLIDHYLHLLHNRFMKTSSEQELALEIYKKHRKALDLIYEYRPDAIQDLTDSLASRLKKHNSKLGIVSLRVDKGILRFIPNEWDTPTNREKDADDWCKVFCQIEVLGRNPVIIATTYSCDPDTKEVEKAAEILHATVRESEFPNEGNKSTLQSEWYAFYRLQGRAIRLSDIEASDESDMVEIIWDWIQREVSNASFRRLTDVVTPLLKKMV